MNITPNTFLTEAKSWLGTQYHHQGRLKRTQNHLGGVDCIGLLYPTGKGVKQNYQQLGFKCDIPLIEQSQIIQ